MAIVLRLSPSMSAISSYGYSSSQSRIIAFSISSSLLINECMACRFSFCVSSSSEDIFSNPKSSDIVSILDFDERNAIRAELTAIR